MEIKKQKDKVLKQIEYKNYIPQYDSQILKLANEVKSELKEGMYISPDKEYLQYDFQKQEVQSICAFYKDNLIGYFFVRIVNENTSNYGKDIGIKDLNNVIHIENVAVNKAYRGIDLSNKMLDIIENNIKKLNTRKYLLVTVHPKNIKSLNLFLNRNYKIVKEVTKYGGFPRNILRKDIN